MQYMQKNFHARKQQAEKWIADGQQLTDYALKELRNGRSWDELEEQISKAWKRQGITITFN